MSVMGHTKMNQLTVAGGKRNEEEDEYSAMILLVLPCWHVGTPKPEVPGQGTMFATNQLSSRTASRTLLHFYLSRSGCPVISLSTPSFCLRQKGQTIPYPTCPHTVLPIPVFLFSLSFYGSDSISPILWITSRLSPVWNLSFERGYQPPSMSTA